MWHTRLGPFLLLSLDVCFLVFDFHCLPPALGFKFDSNHLLTSRRLSNDRPDFRSADGLYAKITSETMDASTSTSYSASPSSQSKPTPRSTSKKPRSLPHTPTTKSFEPPSYFSPTSSRPTRQARDAGEAKRRRRNEQEHDHPEEEAMELGCWDHKRIMNIDNFKQDPAVF